MANSERGEVEVRISDRPYTLKLSTNAVVSIQATLGKTLNAILADVGNLDMLAIRAVVFALLQKFHGQEIDSHEKAGDLIDEAGGVEPFFEALGKMMNKGDAANPQMAPAKRTSRRSTSKPAA